MAGLPCLRGKKCQTAKQGMRKTRAADDCQTMLPAIVRNTCEHALDLQNHNAYPMMLSVRSEQVQS